MAMTIGFVTAGLPFTGATVDRQGIGGSETALICMAKAFHKLGWDVKVYCECPEPGHYDGVDYFHVSTYPQASYTMQFDVLVISRFLEFLHLPSEAGLRILWLHDTIGDPAKLMGGIWQTDKLICLSDFHIENYCSKLEELRPHIWKSSNAVDMDLVKRCIRPKEKGKLIYTSRPERGLFHLLGNIFPLLLQERKDLQLCFANYDISSLGNIPEQVKHNIQLSYALAKQYPQNVVDLGHLTKRDLYAHISSAELLLYPTDFPEISCITAMEAQACGTPVVTTKNFALTETVCDERSGILIPGLPQQPEYVQSFASTVLRLLDDRDTLKSLSSQGPVWIEEAGFTWEKVAKSWEAYFTKLLLDRWKTRSSDILDQLEYESDLAPALTIASEMEDEARVNHLEELISQAWESKNTPIPLEHLTANWKASVDAMPRITTLLNQLKVRPTKILDLLPGDVSFGILLKKAISDVHLTIAEPKQGQKERLRAFSNTVDDGKIVFTDHADLQKFDEGEFDLIVLSDVINCVDQPWEFLNAAMRCLSDDGRILILTAYNAETPTKAKAHDRLWNLSFADFRNMFVTEHDLNAIFCEHFVNGSGRMYGHWISVIRKYPVNPIFVERRKTSTRPYESLACCMIVKDEEDNLRKCLKSVVSYVDKLVVVDTGSSDSTVSIAKSFGAEVREIEFDNFSQARNESIRDINTSWILWLDADEMLVGGPQLRRYLQTRIYEGFVVRQHHLMLDIQGTHDVPIRLLRNKPHYKFTGNIHEHCEDVSVHEFDEAIHPSLVLPDVNLAHYGYTNEKIRRKKCSTRNMALLIRDVKEHPHRKLTWILVMRDFLNIARWHEERMGPPKINSIGHTLLQACVWLFYKHFSDSKSRYYEIAFPMYQAALTLLGVAGLCYEDCLSPPFEVGLALSGAVGGGIERNIKQTPIWFAHADQFFAFMQDRASDLILKLEVGNAGYYSNFIGKIPPVPSTREYDVVKLLSLGVDVG